MPYAKIYVNVDYVFRKKRHLNKKFKEILLKFQNKNPNVSYIDLIIQKAKKKQKLKFQKRIKQTLNMTIYKLIKLN